MAITIRECNIIKSFPVSSVMVAEDIRNFWKREKATRGDFVKIRD